MKATPVDDTIYSSLCDLFGKMNLPITLATIMLSHNDIVHMNILDFPRSLK